MLPFPIPTQSSLRSAVACIIRDVQLQHDETDTETAEKLGVSAGTIANARNKKADLSALTIAKIGTAYGIDAVGPYHALYGASAHGVAASDAAPLAQLADAMAALTRASGPKERLDALPILKAAAESLDAYVMSVERWRNAA
jgi:transcriptional regulator with XRE-family HTH domain